MITDYPNTTLGVEVEVSSFPPFLRSESEIQREIN